MAEYIEREKAIAEIDKADLLVGDNAKWAKEILCRTPTADVVPVVRCKNCIHYQNEWCEILKAESPVEDGFCCYGERKDSND